MTPLDLNLSFSGSSAAAANAGAGDFRIAGGGTQQMQTLYIVAGVLAVLVAVAWLVLRRNK